MDGNHEEFAQLLVMLQQQIEEIAALHSAVIDGTPDKDREGMLVTLLGKLDSFIGLSVNSKESMEIIFKKWLAVHRL
jgi:hypothetical protein